MQFEKYMSLKRVGTTEVSGLLEGECYIYPKIDGCFQYKSKVMLANGKTETIGKIVNNKLNVEVLSYNKKTNRIESKKVIGYHKYRTDKNNLDNEWVTLGVSRNGTQLNSIANSRIKIRVTVNHNIFVEENGKMIEKQAGDLKKGDVVYVPSMNPSVIQEQVLLGTLLGDASAYPNKKENCYNGVDMQHSLKQKDYVDYKKKLLGDLSNTARAYTCKNSYGKEKYGLNTIIDKRTQQIYEICYIDEKKTVTKEWLDKLNTLGLAIWYMDDGSLHKNIRSEIATFHVEGYTIAEQKIIHDFLNSRGYENRIQKEGDYYIIKLSVVGSDKFFTDISQHICESMQYKLPIRFRNRYIPLKDDFDTDISLQRREIISVDKGVICESTFSNNYFKYDIEVEDNHNYFCDGILVHNSNSSIFLGDDGLVHAGSRKRELGIESDKDNAGFYKWVLTQDNLCQFVKDNPHLRLFGEWLVPHTLRTYRDDAWHKLYVFDVYDHNQDRFLTYEEYKPMLEEYNIEYIPCLWKINNPTVDMLLDLLPKNTYLIKDGEGFGEGIVVKNYDYVNKYGRVVWGKIVANEFRDTKAKISKLNAMEGQVSIEETIINKCCTEEFIKKEYHKMLIQLENEGKEWDNKCIPELLGRIWKEFIEEETYEFVKKHKLPTINFRALNGLCIRKIKNTLTEIF